MFDFVGQYALIDKPVLLAATGGSDRHALIIEHQFRPLFSFFQAITLPIGVYASDTDFVDYRIDSTALRERIDQAIARGLPGRAQHGAARVGVRRDLVNATEAGAPRGAPASGSVCVGCPSRSDYGASTSPAAASASKGPAAGTSMSRPVRTS